MAATPARPANMQLTPMPTAAPVLSPAEDCNTVGVGAGVQVGVRVGVQAGVQAGVDDDAEAKVEATVIEEAVEVAFFYVSIAAIHLNRDSMGIRHAYCDGRSV